MLSTQEADSAGEDAVGSYLQARGRKIFATEAPDLCRNTAGDVGTRPFASMLDEAVYLAAQELTIAVHFNFSYRRMTADTRHTHAIGSAEVAETIEDYAILIEFCRTRHVGTVTIDNIGTGVYCGMGKLLHIAAILAECGFGCMGHMAVSRPFGTSVKTHHHYVVIALKFFYGIPQKYQVIDGHRATAGTESGKTYA